MNIEPLETRIAPAAVFTFTDVDGDLVKITTSLGSNADLAAAATLVGGQLRLLNLSAAVFQNTNVTASVVTESAAGDGLVNIGRITASGRDLGNVTVFGDLSSILCGDGNTATPGLDLLSVRSMGLYGTATQGGGTDLTSAVEGALGALRVSGDLRDVSIGARSFGDRAEGSVGSVNIGGSLDGAYLFSTGAMGPVKIGRDLLGGSAGTSGMISCGGKLASVNIGGSLVGGAGSSAGVIYGNEVGSVSIVGDVVGGSGVSSGSIQSGGKLTSLSVGGSVIGGIGDQRYNNGTAIVEGQILVLGDIGKINIAHNLVGGAGIASAKISGHGAIGSVIIGDSVVGGKGRNSALIEGFGNITTVSIGKDLKGGAGDESGKIDAGGKLTTVTIGGSFIGSSGHYDTNAVNGITHTGQIYAVSGIGTVKIGSDVLGAGGRLSGFLAAGYGNDATIKIGSVTIGGSLVGGSGASSGGILSAGSLGAVTIGHSILGGSGDGTGVVSANGGDLASVTIGGSLVGGTSPNPESFSGVLFSRGNMGAVTVGGDVLGGSAEDSGLIDSFGTLGKVTIRGSLVGGAGNFSGAILSQGAIDSVNIGHDLLGGSIPGQSDALAGSGYIISQDRIGSIFIGGSIVSGTDGSGGAEGLTLNASIRVARVIGSLTVGGGLIGNVTPNGDSPVIISAGGRVGDVSGLGPSEVAIGKLSIGGRVEWARILAGYDVNLLPVNADAQIGPVTVGADWIASSMVAGAFNVGANDAPGGGDDNVNFGDFHDRLIAEATDNANAVAKITSITISGQVFGSPESFRPNDGFGFVAEEIGALKIGSRPYTLQAGTANDGFPVALRSDDLLNDATLHEPVALIGFTSTLGAGAKLVNTSTVTYTDADGDKVTVKLSKSLLTSAAIANNVFRFDTGTVNDGLAARQQLRAIDLGYLQTNGLGVTVTVVPAGGDGLAHVGAIVSTGYDMGAVVVSGDLGQIAGGATTAGKPGLASLNVRTLGRLGLDTQGPAVAGFFPKLGGEMNGGLGTLTVKEDIVGANLDVGGAIGSVTIGGSLIGGDAVNSGLIAATTKIGAVRIGDHLQGGFGQGSGRINSVIAGTASLSIGGSILGAGGMGSGSTFGGVTGLVQIAHNVRGGTNENAGTIGIEDGGRVTIGGSLLGGAGTFGGRIVSDSTIGAVKVGHNVQGGADRTARIEGGTLASVTIGGSLLGGFGDTSGSLTASSIGPVKIAHDVHGGAGLDSGKIDADAKLASVSIGGSLLGSIGGRSGRLESGAESTLVTIAHNILGGVASDSGVVFAGGRLVAVTLGGSLVGGGDSRGGGISAAGGMGTVKIGRDVHGGSSVGESGSIISRGGNLASVTIGGSLIGGSGYDSGEIFSTGDVGSVKIGGDIIGGTIDDSGQVTVRGKLTSLTLGGSLFGGTSDSTGVISGAVIGTINLGRNLVGGSIASTTGTLDRSGYVESQDRLAAITVGGSLFAGWDTSTGGSLTKNASIRADADLGSVTVKGSLHGHSTANGLSPVVISGRGQATPLGDVNVAIQKITISGSVDRANIFGGYTRDLAAGTFVSQIGTIAVSGDWTASNVVGGVINLGADDNPGGAGANADGVNFGDIHDTFIGIGSLFNRIASITIGGVVAGSSAAGDHFGFSSVKIGSFKSLHYTAPLTAGTEVIELSPTTGDVTIREL
jgi:hypothetical protein